MHVRDTWENVQYLGCKINVLYVMCLEVVGRKVVKDRRRVVNQMQGLPVKHNQKFRQDKDIK